MAKTKYRVTKPGLNLSDDKGNIREIPVGEEFSHDSLPEFFLSKVEIVDSTEEKSLEVATPQDADKKNRK